MNINDLKAKARIMKEKIGLSTYPVGVKFIFDETTFSSDNIKRLQGYRYCQAVMKARHGEYVFLTKEDISCPAAAAAFGFKPLSESLKNGKSLVGFGITKAESTGKEMFKGMTTIEYGTLQSLYLFPLETAIIEPDVVVVEDKIEGLMWISLSYLNSKGGQRIESSTSILQATCVDTTIIPYKQSKMNLSYGCF